MIFLSHRQTFCIKCKYYSVLVELSTRARVRAHVSKPFNKHTKHQQNDNEICNENRDKIHIFIQRIMFIQKIVAQKMHFPNTKFDTSGDVFRIDCFGSRCINAFQKQLLLFIFSSSPLINNFQFIFISKSQYFLFFRSFFFVLGRLQNGQPNYENIFIKLFHFFRL